jgi:hypothetical protein
LIYLESDKSNSIDSHGKKIHQIVHELYRIEQNMANLTMAKRQFDKAEGHCQRCLAYAKRPELAGEYKISMMLSSLASYSSLRERQLNYPEAGRFNF